MFRRLAKFAAVAVGAVAALPAAKAEMVEKLDLSALTDRAGKVFRGTVIDVEQGSIAIGGGELPTITYQVRVEEMLKGTADVEKDGMALVTMQVLGTLKPVDMSADQVAPLAILREIPTFERGRDYVLFMTPESSAGLSVTVGLQQGAFDLVTTSKDDMVVNGIGNEGLGIGGDGPLSYADLKAAILERTGQ